MHVNLFVDLRRRFHEWRAASAPPSFVCKYIPFVHSAVSVTVNDAKCCEIFTDVLRIGGITSVDIFVDCD